LTITDVVKEIDFELISKTAPRRVVGTHFYVDVANYNGLLRAADEVEAEELLRLLHIFAREVSKIVGSDFDAQKVHFQGPRLHALSYRPVGDDSRITAKALLACLAIRHAVGQFNDVFELSGTTEWKVAAGLDHGVCVATKNGSDGDRELLFLGSPANHAAKILRDSGIRMTGAVHELLPADFNPYLGQSVVDDSWYVSAAPEAVEQLAESFGWDWSLKKTRTRLEDAAEKYTTGCVTVSGVEEKIDKDKLGISNTKGIKGASLFADVDGFTGYIDSLSREDPDLVEAVRAFHVLRGVMRDTAVQDFEAVRIQYQGDRMQALGYRPVDDDESIAFEAVALAAALTSVADKVVPQVVSPAAAKRLAIGIALGDVLVSKIGEHGRRDMVSIGGSTAAAAAIQQRLDGGDIGIDSELRSQLPSWLQGMFTWSVHARAYVKKDLQYEDLMLLAQSEKTDRGLGLVAGKATAGAAVAVGAGAYLRSHDRVPVEPAKPWATG